MKYPTILQLLKKKSTLAVLDQLMLSAASFLTAYVLVTVAGVEQFGVYSFMLVIGLLVHSTFLSLLHGQMTLRIAGSASRIQGSFFKSTFFLVLIFYGLMSSIFLLFLLIQTQFKFIDNYRYEILAAILYTFLLTIYELFRRFLYALNRQEISFYCTSVYVSVLFLGLGWMYLVNQDTNAIVHVYLIYSFSLMVGLIVNRFCIRKLFSSKSNSIKIMSILFKSYFSQGRFAFMGMVVVWLQNQSITPVMMLIGGPAAVGYFNIARLMTMPVVVVNTGVTSSTMPFFRKMYKLKNVKNIFSQIRKYAMLNLAMVMFYAVVLFVFHKVQLFDQLIPGYENVVGFLIGWIFVCMALVFRLWLTQYLVVSMQFRYLLRTGIVATVITLSSMLLVYLSTGNQYLIPFCVLLGEMYLIVQFYTKCAKECK